jgi:hypothetical protein
MKDLWSQELLNGAVDVLANFAWLKLQQHTEVRACVSCVPQGISVCVAYSTRVLECLHTERLRP